MKTASRKRMILELTEAEIVALDTALAMAEADMRADADRFGRELAPTSAWSRVNEKVRNAARSIYRKRRRT